MKKFVVLLAMVAIVAANAFGQTKQEARQIKILEKEIQKTKKEIVEMAKDSLDIYRGDSSHLTYVRNEINRKKEKIFDLENEQETIFRRYATTTNVPKELSRHEAKLRQRGNYLRRQELVLEKVEANLSSIDPSKLSATDGGYKVIVANDSALPINFVISPLDGGERKAVLVDPAKTTIVYLIPGKYSVSFFRGGNTCCDDRMLTVDGLAHNYKGENCFGYVFMPRY